MHTFVLILTFLITNSNEKINSFTTKKLQDLTETSFSINKQFIILEYNNNAERVFNSSIYFIFNKGEISSTKVYIYNSLEKINITDGEFYDYLNKTTLDGKKTIKISYDDQFYKDNCTFYIVLYEPYETYSDSVHVVNSLKNLNFDKELMYTSKISIELSFNFLIEKDFETYLHYQTTGNALITFGSSYYINIKNETGGILINSKFNVISGYIKIKPNVKYYAHVTIYPKKEYDFMNKAFSLRYEKYKNNILIQNELEITRKILAPRIFHFLKIYQVYQLMTQ